jgi:uncharacterized damage-inducible protein DinB
MPRTLLHDAIEHHIWATRRLLDVCEPLTAEQLSAPAPHAYGSIIETLRHVIGSDAFYVAVLHGTESPRVDLDAAGVAELRAAAMANARMWSELLESSLEPDAVYKEVDPDDGFQRWATLGIHVAETLSHGTEHRNQVAAGLVDIGIDPPKLSVWQFGLETGRVREILPGS